MTTFSAFASSADDSLNSIKKQYEALVERAETILLSGHDHDFQQAESILLSAQRLVVKASKGDFRYRGNVKGKFYYAWLLCQKHDPAGVQLFDKILKYESLSADQQRLIIEQRSECQSANSRPVEFRKDTFEVKSTIQKGVTWAQPVYLRSRNDLQKPEDDPWAARAYWSMLGTRWVGPQGDPFIIASEGFASNYLGRLDSSVLTPYLRYFVQQMGMEYGTAPIYVFVANTHENLKRATLRLYDVRVRSSNDWLFLDDAIAYSDAERQRMLAICGPNPTNCTSFAHELFHIMNGASYPDAPWWLSEGMAELYESGNLLGKDRLEFQAKVNWRKRDLPGQALTTERLRALLRLSVNDPALNTPPGSAADMAYARFFCQYLDTRGKLWDVYRALRNQPWEYSEYGLDGESALQSELGGPIKEIAADFQKWIATDVVPVRPSTMHP